MWLCMCVVVCVTVDWLVSSVTHSPLYTNAHTVVPSDAVIARFIVAGQQVCVCVCTATTVCACVYDCARIHGRAYWHCWMLNGDAQLTKPARGKHSVHAM